MTMVSLTKTPLTLFSFLFLMLPDIVCAPRPTFKLEARDGGEVLSWLKRKESAPVNPSSFLETSTLFLNDSPPVA
jgi:hypothetical protein